MGNPRASDNCPARVWAISSPPRAGSRLRNTGSSAGPGTSRRNRRLPPVVIGLHRCPPKYGDGDNCGTRNPDPGRYRAGEQRGAEYDKQHAREQEPGPPASPQGPRQARRPAAGGLADRDGGQAQRSWHRGHRCAVTVPAPRPPGHLCSTAAIRPGHKAQLRANRRSARAAASTTSTGTPAPGTPPSDGPTRPGPGAPPGPGRSGTAHDTSTRPGPHSCPLAHRSG